MGLAAMPQGAHTLCRQTYAFVLASLAIAGKTTSA